MKKINVSGRLFYPVILDGIGSLVVLNGRKESLFAIDLGKAEAGRVDGEYLGIIRANSKQEAKEQAKVQFTPTDTPIYDAFVKEQAASLKTSDPIKSATDAPSTYPLGMSTFGVDTSFDSPWSTEHGYPLTPHEHVG